MFNTHKIIGLACAASLAVASGTAVAGKRVSSEERKTVSADGVERIVIKNPRGKTSVVGKAGLDEITIVITKHAAARSEDKAEKLLAELRCDIDTDGNKVIIEVRRSRGDDGGSLWSVLRSGKQYAYIDYAIEVPSETAIEAATTSGDVRVAGIKGATRISATSGTVTLRDIKDGAWVEITSGTVDAKGVDGDLYVSASSGCAVVDDIDGKAIMQATSGSFEASRIGGDVEVKMVSGNVSVKGCLGDITLKTSSGNAEIAEVDGSINAMSSSGDLDIMILPVGENRFSISSSSGNIGLTYLAARDYGFLLDVNTTSGSIEGDMAIKVEKITRRHLKGVVGTKGKSYVLIETASGDVKIIELKDKNKNEREKK